MERGPLQDAKLAALSETYVACRMTGGSENRSPDIDEFMAKYDVQGFPTLLILSADGGLLARDFDRSPEAILDAMTEAGRSEADFQAFKSAVAAADQPSLWLGLAQLHVARKEYPAAVPILKTVAEKENTPYRWRKLGEAQAGAGDHTGALASYDKLVGLEPTPANHGARARAQAANGDVDGAIGYLRAAAEKTENADDKKSLLNDAAGVRWQQVADAANGGKWTDAEKLMDLLFKEFPDAPATSQARQYEQYIREQAKGGG